MNFWRSLLATYPVNRDLGLLLLRVGIGVSMLALHGWGKISGGPEVWERVGGNMSHLGITAFPVVWGFLAAFSEFVGSILLILGLFFRPAALLLAFTMLVASLRHLSLPEGQPGSGWMGASHALELMTVYLALFLTGAGKLALGYRERASAAN